MPKLTDREKDLIRLTSEVTVLTCSSGDFKEATMEVARKNKKYSNELIEAYFCASNNARKVGACLK